MTPFRVILAALHLVAPHWRQDVEAARLLEELERKHRVDAVLVIAAVRYETRWYDQAVNSKTGTVGLMQIQPLNFQACRDEPGAAACMVVRERLFDWRENLRIGVSYYASARAYCLRRGRGSTPEAWLLGPLGFDAVRGARCGWRGRVRLKVPKLVAGLLKDAASLRHDAVQRSLLEGSRTRGRTTTRTRGKRVGAE